MADPKTITLSGLNKRAAELEKEMAEVIKMMLEIKEMLKKTPAKKKSPPIAADPKKVPGLLKELEVAKKEGDTKKAFTIRKSLRKNGYSLRTENGKKEEKKAAVKTDVKLKKADKK